MTDTKKKIVPLEEKAGRTPISLLAEIEAWLTFRLLGDPPTFPEDDMRQMKVDVAECIRRNTE